MNMDSVYTFLSTTATELAIKILAAVAFWVLGRWLIGRVVSLMQAGMHRNQIDPTLSKYFGSVLGVALNIALVLGILGFVPGLILSSPHSSAGPCTRRGQATYALHKDPRP